MAALRRLASELISQQVPGNILRHLCSSVREAVDARFSAVAVVAETPEQLKLECVSGQTALEHPVISGDSLSFDFLSSLTPERMLAPPGNAPGRDLLTHLDQNPPGPAFLGVHLKTPTKLYGILYLWGKVGSDRFTEGDQDIAEIAAELAAIAYENSLQREALQTLDSRLRLLISQQMSEREQERHRISMAIHDDLGQDLTAVKIQLQLLGRRLPAKKSEVIDQLASITSSVDALIHQVRRIATDLRLPVLDLGLTRAILTHAEQFQSRTGISCDVAADPNIDLDPARAIAVFRVFQESLTNIARHAEATKVKVTVTVVADHLVLKVQDNGRGLAQNPPGLSSLGILGMRERAAQFNGIVTLESRAKGGTTVTMNLPLI